jgi:serine protease Do
MKILFFLVFCSLAFADTVADLPSLRAMQEQVRQIAESRMPLTVALVSPDQNSSGSGVLVEQDGLILTAAHVIQGQETMEVVFPDGKTLTGKVLGANFAKDLGMVRIVENGKYGFAPRGSSRDLKVGDWVVALGHASGYDPARTPPVRFGLVISKGPGIFLTTECTLIGGDSGGPLFDMKGNIVGINSNIGQGLKVNNHAGVDGFVEDWQRMLAGEQWGTLQLDPQQNEEMPVLGLVLGANRFGLVVGQIAPGSKALEADVQPGDLLLSLEGERIRTLDDLRNELLRKQVGDKVKITIVRSGEKMEKEIELVKRGSATK